MTPTAPYADALMIPESLKQGSNIYERHHSITRIAESLLGVDRSRGERAYIRKQGGRPAMLFVTKDRADTIYHPLKSPLQGHPRYAWVDHPGAIRLRPTFRAGKRVDEARLVSGDAEFDRLKSEVEAAIHDDTRDFGGAVTDVAVYMLSKNYDLTDDELADLFAIAMDGAAPDVQWMTRVMAIAHGQNAPKAGSGGES